LIGEQRWLSPVCRNNTVSLVLKNPLRSNRLDQPQRVRYRPDPAKDLHTRKQADRFALGSVNNAVSLLDNNRRLPTPQPV